ncbi:MAG: patatin family protein [Proteobacteria bacterium]|nr:patatin family protein [Pseudomonadota bacterium]
MKRYSKVDQLPKEHASEVIVPGCLVLEGGAFRGVYGEGVCDGLMQADLNFETTIGVSAGALNGISYLSGQIGRTGRINLGSRLDKNYVGFKPWLTSRSVIGVDYLFGTLSAAEPLDEKCFFYPRRKFYVVTTCCETGELAIFEKNEKGTDIRYIYRAISASASMPFVSKMVEIDGQHYLDGGCHTKVPFQWALDNEFEKIVVVRTRPREYRKKNSFMGTHVPKLFYKNYPEFAARLARTNEHYNADCEAMDRLEKEGRIFVIAPSEPVTVGRLETDMEKLGALYEMGLEDAHKLTAQLKSYLGRAG